MSSAKIKEIASPAYCAPGSEPTRPDAGLLVRFVQQNEDRTHVQSLEAFAEEAANLVGADIAFVARVNEAHTHMHSLSVFDRSGEIPHIEYAIAKTPCLRSPRVRTATAAPSK